MVSDGARAAHFEFQEHDDRDPEPDGEEGRLDVRVITAIEQALLTGKPQQLAPFHRAKHPIPDQAIELPAIALPPLVNAHAPTDG